MLESEFTDAERAFLNSQNISGNSVFDARGYSKADYRRLAKQSGCTFVYHNECRQGHRLKTRSGHCIQCDTKKIAYQKRHSEYGSVYLAFSESEGLCKVGQAKDPKTRLKTLRSDYYGGASDWELVSEHYFPKSGEAEFEVHLLLSPFQVTGTYDKNGRDQAYREVFRCEREVGLIVFESVFRRDVADRSAIRRLKKATLIDSHSERENEIAAIHERRAQRIAECDRQIAANISFQHWLNEKLKD